MPDKQLPSRKKLPHAIPPWVEQGARHFITINTDRQNPGAQLAKRIADLILQSALFYEEVGHWYLWLMVVMPDHIHFIATFNLQEGISKIIRSWKRYHSRHYGICWQPDFFEHRLRNDDEFAEKASYIRLNPVRKGLITRVEEWPFVIDRLAGDSSPHPLQSTEPTKR